MPDDRDQKINLSKEDADKFNVVFSDAVEKLLNSLKGVTSDPRRVFHEAVEFIAEGSPSEGEWRNYDRFLEYVTKLFKSLSPFTTKPRRLFHDSIEFAAGIFPPEYGWEKYDPKKHHSGLKVLKEESEEKRDRSSNDNPPPPIR